MAHDDRSGRFRAAGPSTRDTASGAGHGTWSNWCPATLTPTSGALLPLDPIRRPRPEPHGTCRRSPRATGRCSCPPTERPSSLEGFLPDPRPAERGAAQQTVSSRLESNVAMAARMTPPRIPCGVAQAGLLDGAGRTCHAATRCPGCCWQSRCWGRSRPSTSTARATAPRHSRCSASSRDGSPPSWRSIRSRCRCWSPPCWWPRVRCRRGRDGSASRRWSCPRSAAGASRPGPARPLTVERGSARASAMTIARASCRRWPSTSRTASRGARSRPRSPSVIQTWSAYATSSTTKRAAIACISTSIVIAIGRRMSDAAPGAWGRVGARQQERAGRPAHAPPRVARLGLCVSADYRLSPRATFPDPLIDLKHALRWIREEGPRTVSIRTSSS